MIDHTSICVFDIEKSLNFYSKIFEIIGYSIIMDINISPEKRIVGFGGS